MQKTVEVFRVTTSSRTSMKKVIEILVSIMGCDIEQNKLFGGYTRQWTKICQNRV